MDSFLSPEKAFDLRNLGGFGVVLVLRGIWVTVTGELHMDGELFVFVLIIAVLVVSFLFQKMRRYICTSYHNIPVLNQFLTVKIS